jgi:hypothetical protein
MKPVRRRKGVATNFLTSAIDGKRLLAPRPGRFIPGNELRAYCTGGWLGLGVFMDWSGGKIFLYDSSNSKPSSL